MTDHSPAQQQSAAVPEGRQLNLVFVGSELKPELYEIAFRFDGNSQFSRSARNDGLIWGNGAKAFALCMLEFKLSVLKPEVARYPLIGDSSLYGTLGRLINDGDDAWLGKNSLSQPRESGIGLFNRSLEVVYISKFLHREQWNNVESLRG